MSNTRIGRVRAGYTAQYEDPIRFKTGEEVEVSDKTDNWGGHTWVWCSNQAGKTGWVPEGYVDTLGEKGVARVDYDAAELSVEAGEEVLVVDETHGWLLCRRVSGQEGWVPADNVQMDEQ
jgi:uncharacterized protein YgiM (DUF1202 family)